MHIRIPIDEVHHFSGRGGPGPPTTNQRMSSKKCGCQSGNCHISGVQAASSRFNDHLPALGATWTGLENMSIAIGSLYGIYIYMLSHLP